jgi:hypothetical protein
VRCFARGVFLTALTLSQAGCGRAGTDAVPGGADPLLRISAIDAARSRPADPSPRVLGTPGYATLLAHHYAGKRASVTEFRVPSEFVRTASDAPVDNLGFYFFATFPELKGEFSPGEQNLVRCAGYCEGRMMIEIENRSDNPLNLTQFYALLGKTNILSDTQAPPLYSEFDSGIVGDHVLGGRVFGRVSFYTNHDETGRLSTLVKCMDRVPNPTCEEWMSLPGHDDVEVHYTFSMADLPRWRSVHAAVAKLVNSSYVRTFPPAVG